MAQIQSRYPPSADHLPAGSQAECCRRHGEAGGEAGQDDRRLARLRLLVAGAVRPPEDDPSNRRTAVDRYPCAVFWGLYEFIGNQNLINNF